MSAVVRRSRTQILLGAVLLCLAVLTPTNVLTQGDARFLDIGALYWRLAWTGLGAFILVVLPRAGSRDDGAPGLFAGAADPWLLGLLVAAAAVRCIGLNGPLWFDELWMWTDWMDRPFGDVIRTFGSDNNHPLYTQLSWLSLRLFGEEPWAFRLPAAAFGVGGVAVVYLLGRSQFGRREALLAAAIAALAYQLVGFAQDARGYTALLFFGLLSTHAFLHALRTSRTASWVVHGLALGFCVYTHLTGAFVAVGHTAVLLLRLAKDGRSTGVLAGARGLFLGVVWGMCLYALILPQVLEFFLVHRPDPGFAADSSWNSPAWLVGEIARNLHVPEAVAWGGAVVGLIAGVFALRDVGRRAPELVVVFAVSTVSLAAILLGMDRNLWPRLFFVQAGFALLIGVAFGFRLLDRVLRREPDAPPSLGRPEWVVLALTVLGLAALLPRALSLPKQDFPAARDHVLELAANGEPVATIGLARYPYRTFYRAPFVRLDSLADFERVFPPDATGYVLNTFPIFVQSRTPDLWEAVRARSTEVARHRGSKGGGDVVILRIDRSTP